MASSFAWLDYSEKERRRVRDALDLFREQDTRDELGIGVIRDAFAELLFPGTTTIMTRARYYLFVPWMYLQLERREVPAAKFAERRRQEELRLARELLANGESDGVIGRVAGDRLRTLPSSIYWLGLKSWGICVFPGSQWEYHRTVDSFYARLVRTLESQDQPADEVVSHRNWHAGLPPSPSSFPKGATLQLTRDEAEYLCERIATARTATGQPSLMAHLSRAIDEIDVDFAWQHPAVAEAPPHLHRWLTHMRFFSESMHGAALLYNLMLAEVAESAELIDKHGGHLDSWASLSSLSANGLRSWDRQGFWRLVHESGARVTFCTRRFIDSWLDIAVDPQRRRLVASDSESRRLIDERERQLKGARARLHNRRALENWGGSSGASQLDYRWGTARRILADIHDGLQNDA